eukprot:2160827-Pyramimonas_sp.AAC.1
MIGSRARWAPSGKIRVHHPMRRRRGPAEWIPPLASPAPNTTPLRNSASEVERERGRGEEDHLWGGPLQPKILARCR